jgi:hypothetical protein
MKVAGGESGRHQPDASPPRRSLVVANSQLIQIKAIKYFERDGRTVYAWRYWQTSKRAPMRTGPPCVCVLDPRRTSVRAGTRRQAARAAQNVRVA